MQDLMRVARFIAGLKMVFLFCWILSLPSATA
jgi:hypothetical protein